jgi:hypothetical protein
VTPRRGAGHACAIEHPVDDSLQVDERKHASMRLLDDLPEGLTPAQTPGAGGRRRAAIFIGPEFGTVLRADLVAALLGLALHIAAVGAHVTTTRPGRQRRECDPVFLMRLLDAGDL